MSPGPARGLRGNMVMATLIGLAILLGAAIVLTRQSSERRDQATQWVLHTLEVLDSTSRLRIAAFDAMRGERGYLITHELRFLQPYNNSLLEAHSSIAKLNRLVADNPTQLDRLAQIDGRIDYLTSIMTQMISLEDAGRHDEVIARIQRGDGRDALERVLVQLDQFEGVERGLLRQRRAENDQAVRRAALFDGVLALAGVFLLSVGAWASIALRSSLRREEAIRRVMEARASTDELTGLANRRETLAAVDRHMAASRRHGRPMSLAIIDIDFFKRVNDTYGHPAGDEVIRRVAQLCVEVMREEDLVGRLGGEEFVVVLPDTEAAAAMTATDRLRRAVADTTLFPRYRSVTADHAERRRRANPSRR